MLSTVMHVAILAVVILGVCLALVGVVRFIVYKETGMTRWSRRSTVTPWHEVPPLFPPGSAGNRQQYQR